MIIAKKFGNPARVLVAIAGGFILSACTVNTTKTGTASSGNNDGAPTQTDTNGASSDSGDTNAPSNNNSTPTSEGSVPNYLVGTWTASSGSSAIIHTYSADGSYHESSGLSGGSGSCQFTNTWNINGVVSFDVAVGTVTYQELSGTLMSKGCGGDEKVSNIKPDTTKKSWLLQSNVLFTWDPATCDRSKIQECAVQFTKE